MFFPVDRESLTEATSGGNRRARQHNRALPARHVQDQAPGRAPDAPGHAQVQVRRTNPLPSPLFLPWHISCSEITSMLQCLLDITLQVIEGKNFLSTLMRLYHLEQPCRSVHESLICSLNIRCCQIAGISSLIYYLSILIFVYLYQ